MARRSRPAGAAGSLALLSALATLTAACSTTSPVRPPEVEVPRDQRDLVGSWQDPAGRPLPDGREGVLVVRTSAGSTSCSEQDVTVFMELAWPPDRRLDRDASDEPGVHRYVRDTTGSLMQTEGESDLDTSLPAAARSTGISRDGNTLYAISVQPEAIWIHRGQERVERWARLGADEGCG